MIAIEGYQCRFEPRGAFSARRMGAARAPRPDSIEVEIKPNGIATLVPGEILDRDDAEDIDDVMLPNPVRFQLEGRDLLALQFGEPAENGTALIASTGVAEELGRFESGSIGQHWSIVTDKLVCSWPRGLGVETGKGRNGIDFLFYGNFDSRDGTIFIQGPFSDQNAPNPLDLVAPGQSICDSDVTSRGLWADLTYLHEGQRWTQRRFLLGTSADGGHFLITGQAPVEPGDPWLDNVFIVAATLRPSSSGMAERH